MTNLLFRIIKDGKTIKMMIVGVLLLLLTIIPISVTAQNIAGKTDKTKYMVGDEIHYSFTIPLDKKQITHSTNYIFSDTLQLMSSNIDTNGKHVVFSFIFSSFVNGNVKLPEFQIYEQNSSTPKYNISSPSVEITLPDIDTTKVEVKPIKGIFKVPLTFKEIIPWGIGVIVFTAIIWLAIYFIRHREKRPKILIKKPAPMIPEDIEAMENLNRLKSAHLIESGQIKEHYTMLSEILWLYIHRRYGIDTFEKTSNQISEELSKENITKEQKDKIDEVFETSDFVKFAKYIPNARVNQSVMQKSEDFISSTKRIIVVEQKNKTALESDNASNSEDNTTGNFNNPAQQGSEVKNE